MTPGERDVFLGEEEERWADGCVAFIRIVAVLAVLAFAACVLLA